MTQTMTNAEVLWNARDILRKKGWVQEAAEDGAGRHCLAGALSCAVYGVEAFVQFQESEGEFDAIQRAEINDRYSELRTALISTVKEHYGPGFGSIETWNDAAGRTHSEVEAVLEKTAIKLEEQA